MELEEIRNGNIPGRERETIERLLERTAELEERLRSLEIQFETLLDALADDSDRDLFGEECDSYVVECPGCGQRLEIPAEFLEEDEGEGTLACPDCGAELQLL